MLLVFAHLFIDLMNYLFAVYQMSICARHLGIIIEADEDVGLGGA